MRNSVTCFILSPDIPDNKILEQFTNNNPVERVYIITSKTGARNPEKGILTTKSLLGHWTASDTRSSDIECASKGGTKSSWFGRIGCWDS